MSASSSDGAHICHQKFAVCSALVARVPMRFVQSQHPSALCRFRRVRAHSRANESDCGRTRQTHVFTLLRNPRGAVETTPLSARYITIVNLVISLLLLPLRPSSTFLQRSCVWLADSSICLSVACTPKTPPEQPHAYEKKERRRVITQLLLDSTWPVYFDPCRDDI